jgi:hypothetical protein
VSNEAMTRLELILTLVVGSILGISLCAGIVWLVIRSQVRRFSPPFRFFSDPWRDYFNWNWPEMGSIRRRRLIIHTPEDRMAIIWLKQLVQARQAAVADGATPPRLVKFIPEFRWIVWRDLLRPLLWSLDRDEIELRALAILLVGRMDLRSPGRILTRFKSDPHAAVRKEVARALRRHAAFADLHGMAQDSNLRVRAIATSLLTRRHAYAERLAQFASHSRHEDDSRRREAAGMVMFLREPIGPGKPPKSRLFIRQILQHIRDLVRAHFKNHSA